MVASPTATRDFALQHIDHDHFCLMKGYPKEKLMRDRIIHSVTRFQAIWRGYLYKKAYPLALAQRRATIWREFLAWCGSLPNDQFRSFSLFCKLKGIHTVYSGIQLGQYAAAAAEENNKQEQGEEVLTTPPVMMPSGRSPEMDAALERWLWTGEGRGDPEDPTRLVVEEERDARSRSGFLYKNSIGGHVEVLFDEKRTCAAIYSAEVIKIQGQGGDGLYYWVKFHHDGEVRKYHWKRLLNLKLECETFKSKHGILAEIKGKISVYLFIHGASYTTKIYKKKKIKKK
jgi:hypothetical protein